MINAIKRARQAHRSAVEMLYEDTCTVYEYRPVRDEGSKITSKREVLVWEDVPCKLSFESLDITRLGENTAEKAVSVKLFLPPETPVKAGSKIVVNHEGKAEAYSNSGVPGRFPTHQEVELKLFERRA